jgi:hypothetical protein
MDSPITPRFESQGTPAKELIRTRRKALGDAWRKQSASQVDRRRLPEGYCRRRGERRRGVAAGSESSKSRRRRNVKGAIRLVARESRLRRQRSQDDGRLVPAHSSGSPVRDHRPPPRHARSGAGWRKTATTLAPFFKKYMRKQESDETLDTRYFAASRGHPSDSRRSLASSKTCPQRRCPLRRAAVSLRPRRIANMPA